MSSFIGAPELAEALGISVKTLNRRIEQGKVAPAPTAPGEWRRWPLASALAILTSRGCPVPASWTAPAIERAA